MQAPQQFRLFQTITYSISIQYLRHGVPALLFLSASEEERFPFNSGALHMNNNHGKAGYMHSEVASLQRRSCPFLDRGVKKILFTAVMVEATEGILLIV